METILIVDDIHSNIDILSITLDDSYNIKSANSGEEALEIVKMEDKPDMILLDIMMPHMDGYEVIQRLKASKETSHIPVIFISAMQETVDETKGLSLGAADYITKPINPAVVRARVKTHLTIYKQQKELEKQNHELQKVVRILENKLANFNCDKSSKTANIESKKYVKRDDNTKDNVKIDSIVSDDKLLKLSRLIASVEQDIQIIIKNDRLNLDKINEAAKKLAQYSLFINEYEPFVRLGSGILHLCKILNKFHLTYSEDDLKYAYNCFESFIYTLNCWHKEVLQNRQEDPNKYVNSILSDIEEIRLLNML